MRLTGDSGNEVLSLSISYDDIPDDADGATAPPPTTNRFADFRKAKAERSAARSDAARETSRVLREDRHHDRGGDERVRLDRAKQQYLGGSRGNDSLDVDRKTDPSDEGGLS